MSSRRAPTQFPFGSAPATGKACIKCGKPATSRPWFAKAY